MTDDIHTQDTTTDGGGREKASGDISSDAAGKQTSPPGQGDLDQGATDTAREKLEQAGGGH
jgi:hypothetical protein